MSKEYYGVYDNKESDTFRPTKESRIHKDYPISKTLTTKDDSCCVIEDHNDGRERERERRILIYAFVSYLHSNVVV